MTQDWLEAVKWNERGLVPAISQEVKTKRVLTLAWMNREALALTLELGHAVYWSRSRQKIWHKGETSGHTQLIKSIRLDCDGDTLLLEVEQLGDIACHTGRHSCFYLRLEDHEWVSVDPVIKNPKEIYQ